MLTRTAKAHPSRRSVPEGAETAAPSTSIPSAMALAECETATNHAETQILVYSGSSFNSRLPSVTEFVQNSAQRVALSKHPAWLGILQSALGHEPYAIEATVAGRTVGFLPLALLETILFGKFLVSLPYLNSNGAMSDNPAVQTQLIDRAISLADDLNARHLELRHEAAIDHAGLNTQLTSKVHMRRSLPRTAAQLWKSFDPKVRNQVRKGEKRSFRITWGGSELVPPFYDVLTRNMRDLGSPMYGIELFRQILCTFPHSAEICVAYDGAKPVAAALLLHGWGTTEVPTASSLKEYNPSCVNMLMYWHLLQRAVERGQQQFDFGRSTTNGNTFRFKKQWGAVPEPAIWQYRVNRGDVGDMRRENPRYQRAIRLWQKLPLTLTKLLGPRIIRGIP